MYKYKPKYNVNIYTFIECSFKVNIIFLFLLNIYIIVIHNIQNIYYRLKAFTFEIVNEMVHIVNMNIS